MFIIRLTIFHSKVQKLNRDFLLNGWFFFNLFLFFFKSNLCHTEFPGNWDAVKMQKNLFKWNHFKHAGVYV